MSFFDPKTLPAEVILYITDRLTSLRDLNALSLTNHAFDALLSPVLYRHGMRLDTELFLRACDQGGTQTGTVSRLLAAGADPSIQQLSANSLRYTGIAECGMLNTPAHFGGVLLHYGRFRQRTGASLGQEGWELGTRDDAICVRSCTPEKLIKIIAATSREPNQWHVSWSAIHVAAVRGHVGVLKVLLSHQNDLVNSLAAGYGKIDRYEPSMGLRGKFIHMDEEICTQYVESRPQTKFWSMHTPLRAALCAKQEDTARCLIDHGADLEFRHFEHGKHHEHALHIAARHACVDVIEYLCSQRKVTDINVRDSDGWTPLCQAIASPYRNVDTVTTLLNHGADVNAELPGNNGMTHLHLACWQGDWHRAILLLRAGADVHAIWRPDPMDFPPRPEYDSCGPWRAIDLVCMETFTKPPRSTRTYLNSIEDLNDGRRVELLRRLVQNHGADTGPCPGSEHSALAIAATYPGTSDAFEIGGLAMLNTLRDAGIFFHQDHTIITKTLTFPPGLHIKNQRPTVDITTEVVTWLVRHGAPVTPESNEAVFAGIMRALEVVKDARSDQTRLLRDLTAMVKMLVKRGGMDPNIRSVQHKFAAQDGPCSLFQAMLSIQDFNTHRTMCRLMEDLGARPPGLLVALRDFKRLLPPMQKFEVVDFLPAEEEIEGVCDLESEIDSTQEDQTGAELAEEPPSVGTAMDVSGVEQRRDERQSHINRLIDQAHLIRDPSEEENGDEHILSDRDTSKDEDDDEDHEPKDRDDDASITNSALSRQWMQDEKDSYRWCEMNDTVEDLKSIFCNTINHVFKDPVNTTIPSSEDIAKTIFEPLPRGIPNTKSNRDTKYDIEYYRELAAGGIREFLEHHSKTKGGVENRVLAAFVDCARYADRLARCWNWKSE